jgi:RES domain-containing protein
VRRLPTAAHAGVVFCHAPCEGEFALEELAQDDDGQDRWGVPGEKTVYLASDTGVALAEYARHWDAESRACRIVQLHLSPVSVLDLRTRAVRAAVGLDQPDALLDRARTRRLSRDARALGRSQGLIVPSVAFLDEDDRYNVVLFPERLGPLGTALGHPRDVATLTPSPVGIAEAEARSSL